jgi:hypothetical protein
MRLPRVLPRHEIARVCTVCGGDPRHLCLRCREARTRDARAERGDRCHVAFLPKPAAWGFRHARDVVLNGGT